MLSLNILLIIFTSCIIKPSTGINTPKGVYGIKIDSNWLFWNYDWKEKWIKFQIEGIFKADEWFAFGFSDRGDLYNADYCIFYTNSEGKRDVIDAYTDDKCLLQIDKQQHCLDFHYQKLKRLSRFVFIREFDSCDGHDYVIEPGTAHIVWVRGKGGLKVNQNMCNHELSGMVRTTLLRVEPEDVQDQYVWNFTGTVDNLDVPPVETTYWCHTLELPMYITKRKQHLIKFEPVISRGSEAYVHHMELFHCEKDDASEVGALPRYSGLCTEKPKELEVCKKVIAAWAMGASPFVYPKKAGLPIGGHGYSTHVMLEIHYNNPHRDSKKMFNFF
ncbi:hypothetical protein O3M35_003335 [Rhynocoris fuscipes]|uniref:DOMON domain-containing protein n=1 Tax=Rhynocoris fuscipes TaxID=488301 RepID=A0AAW1CK42_9HEMI